MAALELPPGQFARARALLREPKVLFRISVALLAALFLVLITRAWAPPFPFRSGYIPPRDVVAQTEFSVRDDDRTELRKQQRRAETLCIYQHDVRPLVALREAFRDRMFKVVGAESEKQVADSFWQELGGGKALDESERQTTFQLLREALQDDQKLTRLERGLKDALAGHERDGLLESLEHSLEDGNQTAILIHPNGDEDFTHRVEVDQVRIATVVGGLRDAFRKAFVRAEFTPQHAEALAATADRWFQAQGLPVTLSINQSASEEARLEAVKKVKPAYLTYRAGDRLASGGKPLTSKEVALLQIEHEAQVGQMSFWQMVRHALSVLGMYVAMYVLCGAYLFYKEPRVLADLRRFSTVLLTAIATVTLCWFTASDHWRAEIIPLTLFGMTIALAYEREVALFLSAVVALVVALSLGQGLAEFVILVGAVSVAVLLLTGVRNRTKLIYIGCCAGLVTMLTTIGVGTMVGQAFGLSNSATLPIPTAVSWWPHASFAAALLSGAAWFGFCGVLAGVIMTGLLPFVERVFDVQTDLSLLELGDAAHPLLQELARRAPGTYNHSINVASLAEAAAEAIGANGLLLRVGAYFHDIGKMLKPNYFVENQGQAPNRHDSLVPAMSTLVIIAHVKDGADLARQHHLPQPIIDFIEQHHGTTLVEYFFEQASRQSEENPENGGVDETAFRYPGPKPQTREAAVMMLADAVESASRTLVDPTPARIESLVQEIVMKRLLDEQFVECGLTLEELHLISVSLAKSLTATYHGRVKYPDQQTA